MRGSDSTTRLDIKPSIYEEQYFFRRQRFGSIKKSECIDKDCGNYVNTKILRVLVIAMSNYAYCEINFLKSWHSMTFLCGNVQAINGYLG